MRKHLYIAIILSFICALPIDSMSQGSAIGSWRTHLPYSELIDVVVVDDMVYAATELSIFTYNKLDNRVDRFDKVKGLNDIGISKIGYNSSTEEILVAYTNANLDIITKEGIIINLPEIKDKEILGNKTINNITFNNNYAYLSCGFGIVILDMDRKEVFDTYYIGPEGDAINVYSVTYNDTSLFAATESGIYFADIDGSNLADYHQWEKEERLLYPNLAYNHIVNFQNKIYTNYFSNTFQSDTMFVFDGYGWDYFQKENNHEHKQMNAVGDQLLIVNYYDVSVFNKDAEFEYNIWQPSGQYLTPLSADMDDEFIWIGDKSKGLVKTWNMGWAGEYIKPNGPGTNSVFDLSAGGNNVWVASGGRQSNWAKLYMKDGVFSFTDENWTTHNQWTIPALDTISDYVCAIVDPINPNIAYIGTWQAGIIKFANNEISTIYTQSNSSLQPWVANPALINVSGIDFDSQNNLWAANSGAPDLLSVMKTDGEWMSFNFGGSLSGIDIGELMIDSYDQKWIIKRSSGLVMVYTNNNTIDDIGDDDVKTLYSASGQGNIPGNKVYSFATDHDGEVWVGTDKGVSVFYSPENIFVPGANFDAQQILVPRNDGSGLADYLLETELVTAIAIDGANRKWIGTERAGLFLFSPDGLEQIEHFTSENSPLLSNNINSLSITEDGEIFIGTANGIISYKGTATPPQPAGSKVYAYPNPVRENFTGLIAIKGLENNSFIKITDSYGNLVYQTKSEGGQAIWDGNNFNGEKVATGIYMVFAVTTDKSEKVVTKILVIK